MGIRIDKVVAALPGTLEPDTVYAVRVGAGFDLYITDALGQTAHSLNGGGGSSTLSGAATIGIPDGSGVIAHTEIVAAVGVTLSNVVILTLHPGDDADENDPEMLDVRSLAARPLTDEIEITVTFGVPASGPVRLNWSVL